LSEVLTHPVQTQLLPDVTSCVFPLIYGHHRANKIVFLRLQWWWLCISRNM